MGLTLGPAYGVPGDHTTMGLTLGPAYGVPGDHTTMGLTLGKQDGARAEPQEQHAADSARYSLFPIAVNSDKTSCHHRAVAVPFSVIRALRKVLIAGTLVM